VSAASQIFTTLTLTPCSVNLYGTHAPLTGLVVQFLIMNEYEQRFSTSRSFTQLPSMQLSNIDTHVAERSVFSAAVQGTLTGTTRIRSGGDSAFIGMAVERHESLADAARVTTAAFNLHSEGERATPEVIELGPCALDARACLPAGSNTLVLADHADDRRDQLTYKWRKGAPAEVASFGDPTASTEYALCLYSGTASNLIAELRVPPSSGTWQRTRQGFSYMDPTRSNDGVRQIRLKRGAALRSLLALEATGDPLPSLPLGTALPLPVRVRVVNSDTGWCAESVFDTDDVEENQPGSFLARSSL
jgi:hypothetical protein